MLDYIYFRLTKAYIRWEGEDNVMGEVGLTFAIGMHIIVAFLIVTDLIGILQVFPGWFKLFFIIGVEWIVSTKFQRKYKNRYDEFEKKWINEPKRQKIWRGIGVVVFLAMPLILYMLYMGFTAKLFGVNFLGNY